MRTQVSKSRWISSQCTEVSPDGSGPLASPKKRLESTPNGCTIEIVLKVVVLSRQAQKELATVPMHVAVKFQNWVEDVEDRGLEEVRKISGYHDEPLKGALKGLRSIRLSKGYRAYYRIVKNAVELIRVERVDKHVY